MPSIGDVNKIEKAGVHTHKSTHVNAPIIEKYPLTLECRVKSWDVETGYLIGEIVASQADERILTDGRVDLGKLRPIIFDPSFNAYRIVGEVVGRAFSDGMKLKQEWKNVITTDSVIVDHCVSWVNMNPIGAGRR